MTACFIILTAKSVTVTNFCVCPHHIKRFYFRELRKMKMFGKKKEKPSTSPQVDALQELRQIEELLNKKQEHLESKIEAEAKTAKANARKNKQAALQALKRKKRLEQQLQRLDGTLTTIELQIQGLEEANINKSVFRTMRNAATALQNVHLDVNVGEIDNLIDDICDQRDLVEEMATAISMPVAFDGLDEDELEKELEALEEEILEEKVLQVPQKQQLGEVSARSKSGMNIEETVGAKKKSSRKEDDDDIKKLEYWAS